MLGTAEVPSPASMRLSLLCSQMKTVSVALVLCLNVGVDPPDVVKTTPCARLECWIGKRVSPPRPVPKVTGPGFWAWPGRPCVPAQGRPGPVCANRGVSLLRSVP